MADSTTQAITWRADFATGVGIMDDQHRVLVKMLNEASTQLSDTSPLTEYESVVKGLLGYAGYHFQTEEKLMAEYGYEKNKAVPAAEHIKAHRGFAEKVVMTQDQLKAGKRIPKDDLVSFLTDWLTDHILHTDKELGAYLRDKMAQTAAGKT
ncbi:MAG: bacteriohemerythrin [Proteobacteria bacterium]|nr:bacteriohemerythrin [Pseudomonadota bacterium]